MLSACGCTADNLGGKWWDWGTRRNLELAFGNVHLYISAAGGGMLELVLKSQSFNCQRIYKLIVKIKSVKMKLYESRNK